MAARCNWGTINGRATMTMRKERVLTGLSGAGTTTRLGFVCVLLGLWPAEGGLVLDVTVIRAAAAAHVFPLGTQKHTVASAALSPPVSFSPPAASVYARGAPCVFIFVIGVTREPAARQCNVCVWAAFTPVQIGLRPRFLRCETANCRIYVSRARPRWFKLRLLCYSVTCVFIVNALNWSMRPSNTFKMSLI